MSSDQVSHISNTHTFNICWDSDPTLKPENNVHTTFKTIHDKKETFSKNKCPNHGCDSRYRMMISDPEGMRHDERSVLQSKLVRKMVQSFYTTIVLNFLSKFEHSLHSTEVSGGNRQLELGDQCIYTVGTTFICTNIT